MAALDHDALQKELKKKSICRFCLTQNSASLTNIFFRDTRIKSSAPLPIQVMAIASIEVFSNDGMPPYVCSDCISTFEYSYQFKQMCKRAENLLRQYPLVGVWPKSLEKPVMPKASPYTKQLNRTTQIRDQKSKNISQTSLLLPKKILNGDAEDQSETNNISNMEQYVTKVEKVDDESCITYLDKIDNNDELSIDDIQLLVASEDVAEAESIKFENLPIVSINSSINSTKPKLLNKSSVRILNKEASRENEPRLTLPKIKKTVDGNMEIVAEILNVDDRYGEEPDPKNAELVETNIFPCSECERTFPLVQLRDLHMKKHSRERKFDCEVCDKSFFSKYDLQRHMFIHNGQKPYVCSACDKAFSRSTLLTQHEKIHTDVPKFICVHCERSFISKENMERHVERHNINRPFQCKICNKGFAFKQGLERHESIHSRQQPYPCQYCEKSFSTPSKLARHLKAHAGLRPHPCRICKKSYLLSHHLTRHLRSHNNINDSMTAVDFMCSTCKTSFKSRDELIEHSKTHADEDNLGCPLCKETFDNMSVLISHIQDHSEGEAYACEFCDLIFLTAEKLQMHTDSEHVQEMEAYHEDDRAQASKKKQEESTKEEFDINDEKLQCTVNAFLMEEFSDEENDPLKKKIKSEEETSPKIINQIIIQTGNEETKIVKVDKADENNSVLIPAKQRKLDVTGKKVAATPPVKQNKQSPQLKRKVANTATPTINANQPTIQSLLKVAKGKLPTKSTASPPEQKSLLIKVEKDETPLPTSTTKAEDNQNAGKAREKKVQKIRVTKAEAAAMAKDGRIIIKDGKIILNT